jgi:carbamoyltransferase
MEFGPRALGNRSILADPRKSENKRLLNFAVKFREGF